MPARIIETQATYNVAMFDREVLVDFILDLDAVAHFRPWIGNLGDLDRGRTVVTTKSGDEIPLAMHYNAFRAAFLNYHTPENQ